MKDICIITHSHLCRNPRVVKEAGSLTRAGYRVTILTTWTNAELLRQDLTLIDTSKIRYVAGENIMPGNSSVLGRFISRLRRRLAGELVRLTGIGTVHALGYSFKRNLRKALSLKSDLYICHQELPTAIGCRLIKIGFRVAFDFEDWYSHDLPTDARKTRPVKLLKKYEKFALRNGALSYTTSEALAAALSMFASSKQPEVLYNAFPFSERDSLDGEMKDRRETGRVSLHWYSQTLGPGRGLEELAEALNRVGCPFELHLRGNCSAGYKDQLLSKFNTSGEREVFIHPLVSHQELLSRIAEHDIGLALEKNEPESRDRTITNKILQYLQGSLAVLASPTAGQLEVARMAGGCVYVFHENDPLDLAEMIESLARDKKRLEETKLAALRVSRDLFCWEVEEKKLLRWINNLEL